MFKQGSGPYFISLFGDIYPVFKKNRLVGVAQPLMCVKKTTAGLHGERLNMTVEVGDFVIGQIRELHREEAADQNLCSWIVMSELDDYFFKDVDKLEIAGEYIMRAHHYHDHIGVCYLLFDVWQGGEQIGGGRLGHP